MGEPDGVLVFGVIRQFAPSSLPKSGRESVGVARQWCGRLSRAKSAAGLADDEARNWIGWRYRQTLSLIATWFLTTES